VRCGGGTALLTRAGAVAMGKFSAVARYGPLKMPRPWADAGAVVKSAQAMAQSAPTPLRTGNRCEAEEVFLIAR
jgi:hypothetical protein